MFSSLHPQRQATVVLLHIVSLQWSGNLGHHDHIISDGGGRPSWGFGAVLHADDVTTALLKLRTTENISHGGLRGTKALNYLVDGWVNKLMNEDSGRTHYGFGEEWIDGHVAEMNDVGMDGMKEGEEEDSSITWKLFVTKQ